MKVVRGVGLLGALLVGLWWYTDAARAQLFECLNQYNACIAVAAGNRDTCYQNCDAQNPPGTPENDACRGSCNNVYNGAAAECGRQRAICDNAASDACRSGCLGYCGTGNLLSANYNPNGQYCTCFCNCPPPKPSCPNPVCSGGSWVCESPILIDVLGDGFRLTGPEDGVFFDLAATGQLHQLAWTERDSDDGWLALDRNGNGVIDDGKELFGSAALQPPSPKGETPNGFLALAVFDRAAARGNLDGLIDAQDAVFPQLRVWVDANHNGISEPSELKTLTAVGISRIDLAYNNKKMTDRFGNEFRFRARVWDRDGHHNGQWAWDVFLKAIVP